MRIVVTGATSFLGAAAVKKFLSMGRQVYGIIRPGSVNRAALPQSAPGLKVIELELERLPEIGNYIEEECPLFLHLGWDGSGSENRKNPAVQQKNVKDSMGALLGAESLGCRRFLFGGSQAEYGRGREIMEEDSPCSPVSEYGRAKLAFGKQARAFVEERRANGLAGMEYVHARIFSVYGPGDHPWSLVNTCLDTFLQGGEMKLGACTQYWNYLYIDDLINAFCSLLFHPGELTGGGIYNIAASEEATRPLKEYVEEIHNLCGGRGSCCYGVLPPNAEGPADLRPRIRRIKEACGWEPEISFHEGIRRMLEGKCLPEKADNSRM